MSLDLYIVCSTCGASSYEMLNITHNIKPICRAVGIDPWAWQGRLVRETLPELNEAIRRLKVEDHRHLEPKNGWGSQDATRSFLGRVRAAAENAEPGRRWRVSK